MPAYTRASPSSSNNGAAHALKQAEGHSIVASGTSSPWTPTPKSVPDLRSAASWPLAPHTGAKLALLRAYLDAWFPILSSSGPPRVFYIDGFAGPGRYSGGEDGSPIVALKALGLRANLARTTFEFHFVERRRRQVRALRANIDELQEQKLVPKNAVIHVHDHSQFAEVFKATIAPRLASEPGAPAFALVDPFGWKGLPMSIMRELMRRPRTELLINFMFEEINRFLNHPDQPANFDEFFGDGKWREGCQRSGPARRAFLHDLYQDQLRTVAGARYVRSFEMLNERGASDYFLFFATNNLLGLSKMKEAMWRVDPGGGTRFSDTTEQDQLVLLAPEPDRYLLRRILQGQFVGRRVRVQDVEKFVLEETAFHGGHYKKVLAELENSGLLTPVSPPSGRQKKTFGQPTLMLQFS